MIAALRLALRNLTRNRRRASIALLTVVVAVVAMVLADGFAQWIFWAMREGTIQSELGHIEVVRPGYARAGIADPFAYLLPERSPVREDIEKTPGVRLVAARLNVTGLVSHGETTLSFIAEGVEPAKETELSKAVRIVGGRNLSAPDAREVVLGQGLAHSIGVAPGDTVALLANTGKGGINGVEATVVGLFVTVSKAYDDAALRLPIGLAQQLLRVKGAHAWLVLLDDTDRTDAYLADFRRRFPQTTSHLAFIPWYERADFYNKTVALFSQQMNVLRVIIAAIIVLGISNILAMSVIERTGEIGTLLAIGSRRSRILRQFATEGVLLGLAGAVLGVVIGVALAYVISAVGIPMPPPPGMEHGYTGEIRLTAFVLITPFLIALVTTALAGVYPAWRASRLKIVDALRHNV
jgi:putative ABC transport system permease protein